MERQGPPCAGASRGVPGVGLAVLLGVALASLAGCLVLGWLLLARGRTAPTGSPVHDPELRRELLARLAMDANAPNDSHPDAEVARVLSPASRFEQEGLVLSTNRAGMREREVELPKPAQRVRIALLGDSFVFGVQCNESERLGGRMEHILREALTDPAREVEVLSFGVSSW